MLKAIGWILFVPGLFAFVGAVYIAVQEPSLASVAIAFGVFVGAFLTPAVLFALADIVQHTRETRDAVRALGGTNAGPAAHAPETGFAWEDSVDTDTAAREALEEGARARARRDAGSVGDRSRER